MSNELVFVGDYVGFTHDVYGYSEGIVVGSRVEYPSGRKVVEVEVDPGVVHYASYPTVKRIRRVQYSISPPVKKTTVERRIYW